MLKNFNLNTAESLTPFLTPYYVKIYSWQKIFINKNYVNEYTRHSSFMPFLLQVFVQSK